MIYTMHQTHCLISIHTHLRIKNWLQWEGCAYGVPHAFAWLLTAAGLVSVGTRRVLFRIPPTKIHIDSYRYGNAISQIVNADWQPCSREILNASINSWPLWDPAETKINAVDSSTKFLLLCLAWFCHSTPSSCSLSLWYLSQQATKTNRTVYQKKNLTCVYRTSIVNPSCSHVLICNWNWDLFSMQATILSTNVNISFISKKLFIHSSWTSKRHSRCDEDSKPSLYNPQQRKIPRGHMKE
jgi:hypothetical protein